MMRTLTLAILAITLTGCATTHSDRLVMALDTAGCEIESMHVSAYKTEVRCRVGRRD